MREGMRKGELSHCGRWLVHLNKIPMKEVCLEEAEQAGFTGLRGTEPLLAHQAPHWQRQAPWLKASSLPCFRVS